MRTAISVLLLASLCISCGDVKKPVFQNVENLKVGKMGVTETTVSADIRFNNLNSFGVRIKKIDFDLYVDSNLMGHFTNTEPVRIKARKSFSLPLSGQANTLIMAEQTRKAFLGQQSFIRVEGAARVGRSGFYKTIPFNYRDTLVLGEVLK